jgi:hypothetical protein
MPQVTKSEPVNLKALWIATFVSERLSIATSISAIRSPRAASSMQTANVYTRQARRS